MKKTSDSEKRAAPRGRGKRSKQETQTLEEQEQQQQQLIASLSPSRTEKKSSPLEDLIRICREGGRGRKEDNEAEAKTEKKGAQGQEEQPRMRRKKKETSATAKEQEGNDDDDDDNEDEGKRKPNLLKRKQLGSRKSYGTKEKHQKRLQEVVNNDLQQEKAEGRVSAQQRPPAESTKSAVFGTAKKTATRSGSQKEKEKVKVKEKAKTRTSPRAAPGSRTTTTTTTGTWTAGGPLRRASTSSGGEQACKAKPEVKKKKKN